MRSYVAAALLGLGSTVYGQYVSQSENGISYKVSVPASSASAGSGDIYLQISGPSSNSWIGFGQGSQMSGAKMFIIYANSAGTNVTLSPRKGSGHTQPTYDSSAQVSLLEGSGISNGVMTANIKCSDCKDITSSSSSWVYAALSGSALNSDSTSATISQHSNTYGIMTLDMTSAKNSANTNPFVSGSSAASGSSGASATNGGTGSSNTGCVQAAQTSGSSGSNGSNGGSTATTTGGFPFGPFGGGSYPTGFPGFGGSSTANNKRAAQATGNACVNEGSGSSSSQQKGFANAEFRTHIFMAHGILGALAFVIIWPLGAIAIRVLSFPGLVAFHAACQTIAWLLFVVCFGLGVYIANNTGYINQPHAVIGIILFILAFFQPILGFLHHSNYKKVQARTSASHGHIWLGRIIITLGMINGGLGIKLADNAPSYGPIVYAIFAAVFWVAYVVAIFIGERRKSRNADGPPKYDEAVALNTPRQRDSAGSAPREYYAGRK